MSDMDKIKTTTIRLLGRDRHSFSKLVVDWQEELDDISLSISEALNATVRLMIRAANPELIRESAIKKGMTEDQIKQTIAVNEWFMNEFMEVLREVVDSRNRMDRRKNRSLSSEDTEKGEME